MKRSVPFLILLAGLAALCGWFLSHISFIGRVGINVAFQEYSFLKTWWKGAALVFGFWVAIYWIHSILLQRYPSGKRRHLTTGILALLGLYATYADFGGDLSHRLLGERFHLGSYLFWIGLIAISFRFYLLPKSRPSTT